MKDYQKEFIEFALEKQVLKFGEFTLKSGRTSPYFFNAGLFNTGRDLARLGRFYASALEDAAIEYDVLFGPAYKGIPIATTTAGKNMLVDDVITAGTAIRESMEIIADNGADLSGVLIALDRQEKGKAELSAIQEVERDFNTKVISIVKLADLISYLESQGTMDEHLASVKAYRDQYGIA